MSEAHHEESMYKAREPIHPRSVHGKFRQFKTSVLVLAYAVFFLLPWLRWDRAVGPDQAVMFDIPARKYYLFDLVIYPQDMFLLAGFLIIAAWLLFFVTGLVGRAFCGYFCFQTLWTDFFMKIERLVQGERPARMRLEKSGWTGEKIAKKGLTWLLWAAAAFWTGFTFTAYWANAPQLFVDFFTGNAVNAAYITTGILTVTTLVAAGFAREQVCIYMCPYARFQSVMFDKESLLVSYDYNRGEGEKGRGKLRRGLMKRDERKAEGLGDCIDCGYCVQVCPTGIDIRDGLQIECISCGLCIDACNEIMDKQGWPRGLIRYASEVEIETGKKPPLWKFRTIGYGVAISVATAFLIYGLLSKAPADFTVEQIRNPLAVMTADGRVQNSFEIKINNKTQQPLELELAIDGLEGARMSVSGDFEVFEIPPESYRTYLVRVRLMPEGNLTQLPFEFVLDERQDRIDEMRHDATFYKP
ncbi:MAG: cytochrome c oxidase accessory protein CcoG [Halothiobacillaceae bacterium]